MVPLKGRPWIHTVVYVYLFSKNFSEGNSFIRTKSPVRGNIRLRLRLRHLGPKAKHILNALHSGRINCGRHASMTCYIPVLVKRKINKNTKTKKTDKTSAVAEKYQWHHAKHDNGEHSSASQIYTYVYYIYYCYVCMCIYVRV